MPDIKKTLLHLDFSQHDAEVYQELLKNTPCGAGLLIKNTGLHRNIVYTSLNHLISRKLVSEKKVKNIKTFSLTDPMLLIEEFEKKKQKAEEIVQTVKQYLPQNSQEISVHEGTKEYLNLLTSLIKALPKNSKKYVLGTGGDEFMQTTMLKIWEPYHAVAREQKLKIKMIGYESQRGTLSFKDDTKKMYSIKFLPDHIENPAGMHIYPELGIVLNIIYSNKTQPVTAIKIKNKRLAESYLVLFENLWKTAKN